MIVVSTRDFRANQTKYMDMANEGEDVVLKSRDCGSFKLVPVTCEETMAPPRDLTWELKEALIEFKEYLDGKRQMKTIESLIDELRDNQI